jgi:hypothetical protein
MTEVSEWPHQDVIIRNDGIREEWPTLVDKRIGHSAHTHREMQLLVLGGAASDQGGSDSGSELQIQYPLP